MTTTAATTSPVKTRTTNLFGWQAAAHERISLLVVPVKPQPPAMFSEGDVAAITNGKRWAFSRVYSPGRGVAFPADPEPGIKPPFSVGDVLIGRETWAEAYDSGEGWLTVLRPTSEATRQAMRRPVYRADYSTPANAALTWKPARSMPDDFARFRRPILSVAVKRVQEIDELEVLAMGIEGKVITGTLKEAGKPPRTGEFIDGPARDALPEIWDRDHRAFPWDSNCWCWLIGVATPEQSQ